MIMGGMLRQRPGSQEGEQTKRVIDLEQQMQHWSLSVIKADEASSIKLRHCSPLLAVPFF